MQDAALHGTYAWALLGQTRNGDAERVAFAAAQRIEPKFSTATPQQFTVWGGLVLWAMGAAVEGARKDAAIDYIRLAQGGAAQLTEGDRHDNQINFGPTQMAMQTTYAYATLGEPGRALDAAQHVRRVDLHTISYGRQLLDMAQAQVDARRIDLATDTLVKARDVAPIWFRHQAPARSLVRDLAERQTRRSPRLRDLVRSLEPR